MSRSIYNDAGRAGMSDTTAATKRFAITLDRVLVGLLLVEGLLFLSDQYDWFAINRRKGWTVLIAVAVVGGVLLLTALWAMASWVVARWTRGRPFQFGLRSGLLLVLVAGLVCGWLGSAIEQARWLAEIRKGILKAKGGNVGKSSRTDAIPNWLTRLLGSDFFVVVTEATAIDDNGLLQIARLSDLERLQIDGWGHYDPKALVPSPQFSMEGLGRIESIAGLKFLSLYGNDLSSKEVASLRFPNTLEGLEVWSDEVSDLAFASFGKLPRLRQLQVRALKLRSESQRHEPALDVTDAGLEHLSGLVGLHILTLNETRVTDGGLAHLQGLGELRMLELTHANIQGSGLGHLKALPKLEWLDISGNQINGDYLESLPDFPNLRHLGLSDTDIGDIGLAHVGRVVQLESLDLSGSYTTSEGLLHLKPLTGLKVLNVWAQKPDREFTKILGEFERLEEVRLCVSRFDGEMASDLHALKKLKSLTIRTSQTAPVDMKRLRNALPKCTINLLPWRPPMVYQEWSPAGRVE